MNELVSPAGTRMRTRLQGRSRRRRLCSGDQRFESAFLQRRVGCELGFSKGRSPSYFPASASSPLSHSSVRLSRTANAPGDRLIFKLRRASWRRLTVSPRLGRQRFRDATTGGAVKVNSRRVKPRDAVIGWSIPNRIWAHRIALTGCVDRSGLATSLSASIRALRRHARGLTAGC